MNRINDDTIEQLNNLILNYQEDKISLLENNLSYVMTYFTILIAVVGVATTILISLAIAFLNKRYKQNYEDRLKEIKDMKSQIEAYKGEIEKDKSIVNRDVEDMRHTKDTMKKQFQSLGKKLEMVKTLNNTIEGMEVRTSFLEDQLEVEKIRSRFIELKQVSKERFEYIDFKFNQEKLTQRLLEHYSDWKYNRKNYLESLDFLEDNLSNDYSFEDYIVDFEETDSYDSYRETIESGYEDYLKECNKVNEFYNKINSIKN